MTDTNADDVSILIVDDELSVRDALQQWFRKDGFQAHTAADAVEALRKLSERTWGVILLDIKMPGIDGIELQRRIRKVDPNAVVIIITAYASVDTAVEAMKNGAFDYVTKPIDPDELSRLVRRALEHRHLRVENVRLRDHIAHMATGDAELIGDSPQMKEVVQQIETVAATDVTVLILGESGTGKELVARMIHTRSRRRHLPMVAVNCGALTESLLESELFGHEKGAFTGAMYRHKGKLEMAHGGTLFLDEIATIAPKTQVDLLRVLDTKQFTRLGGNQVIAVDFRVMCATNRNLAQLVKEGTFREDLYYRLAVFEIRVPPLRERRSDIPNLARHFVKKYASQLKKNVEGFSDEAMSLMMKYEWRGNVRELENAVERAVVVCKLTTIDARDLPLQMANARHNAEGDSLAAVEKAHILHVLESSQWNITRSARVLGIDRVTLYNKIKKYGLRT
ncbi:MAG: sigma-54 dependent transcriptional regulator [Candidatus Krumholzibacteria bacterium]|nr:sigma-54 dependent transcriptional regulator [Candidatus Krumholzibacteria bacterium]